MKYLFSSLFLFLTLLPGTAQTARIAAWNVAAGRNDQGGTPIPPDRIKRLGETIAAKIKPDVLVMEEVWPASASAEIAKASTDAGFPLEAVEIPPQDPAVVQLVTILKRPGVEIKDAGLIDKSNDLVDGDDPEEKTTRKAVIAQVKVDQFDFILVGVHLKSKRESKTATASPLEMRNRQCKVIADRLHELIAGGKEKDVLLIGDFNMTPEGQSDSGEETDEKNFTTLDSHQEFRFLSSESRDKTHLGFYKGRVERSKLDGYAITHTTEPAYVKDSFRVLNNSALGATERQFTDKRAKNFISDHYPLVAEFDKTKDADEPADPRGGVDRCAGRFHHVGMIEKALVPKEGWYVLHLFYRIEHGQWEVLSAEEKIRAKTDLSEIVQEARSMPDTQLLTFSIVSPKADLGFMLLSNDLVAVNSLEKKLTLSLGEEILTPVFSFLSMTERSEYFTSSEDYAASLTAEKGLAAGSAEHTAALAEFSQRMAKYARERLYPELPDWPIFCFYPMNKRRDATNNWYALDHPTRKKLMAGHAAVGRTYAGRVKQLITGSTGLDDAEWGVTLFAHDLYEIKSIVYEMRFDEVSAKYADFGDFFIGLQMPLNELFHQVRI